MKDVELCPKVILHTKDKIDFTDTEKRLLCGDPNDPAYKMIPGYQAKFSMEAFLQSRGYSRPDFKYEGDILHAYSQDKTRLSSVTALTDTGNNSKELADSIYSHNRKESLTPQLLDSLENEAKKVLRDKGYPCVKVSSLANSDTGNVALTATNLERFNYGEIPREEIEGVDGRALARFYPFKPEDSFTESGLTLAEKRYLRAGVVQGTFFQESCDVEHHEFHLNQEFIVGPPRTVRFGVGASTEVGPMARIKWSNQRYGSMASLLEASLQVSLKDQTMKFSADQYLWANSPRTSLVSELSFSRHDLSDYLENVSQLKSRLQRTHDTVNRLWTWNIGPDFMIGSYKTDLNSSLQNYKGIALQGTLESKTHEYELYDFHPESGNVTVFNFDYRDPNVGFNERLLKMDLSYLRLFDLGHWGQGSGIFGLRLNAGTTAVSSDVGLTYLPPSVKFYGGGSDDLRGFKLSTLPDNGGAGALTKLGAKVELRKTHFIDEHFESFGFIDSAFFGEESWKVDSRLWYSPGVGVRWISPIGLIQTYVARSLSTQSKNGVSSDEGFFFYLGIGGIF